MPARPGPLSGSGTGDRAIAQRPLAAARSTFGAIAPPHPTERVPLRAT
ncbi:MAG TPA: hypothetical protein V6D02_17310 [Candidatus Obscuribacterales bacterium]